MPRAHHDRMKRLLQAPHRVFFLAAALNLLLASAWWGMTIAMRTAGMPALLAAGVAPAPAHAFLMIFGFFPLFIFGFLFTAAPRWLGRPPPTRRDYLVPAALAVAGTWPLVPALAIHAPAAAGAALFLMAAWGWMLGHVVVLLHASRSGDRLHALLVTVALGVGLGGLAAARNWLLTGSAAAASVMETLGLWGFLVPVFVTVSHRMIPHFTSTVVRGEARWRPAWPLLALVAASAGHGALVLLAMPGWTWAIDLPAGALALYLSWRWGVRFVLRSPMLAMMHAGFAWLGAAWLLHGLQSITASAGGPTLGLAPVHALAIGFLASLTLAMVSRVSAGGAAHASPDRMTLLVFALLQGAALARIAADLWIPAYIPLLVVAVTLWLAGFSGWAWRHVPFYWRPSRG